jgi:hypothetical protein
LCQFVDIYCRIRLVVCQCVEESCNKCLHLIGILTSRRVFDIVERNSWRVQAAFECVKQQNVRAVIECALSALVDNGQYGHCEHFQCRIGVVCLC